MERNQSFNTGRQKQQATKQQRMWGKEEAMKKWIWKHEKKARTQRTEQEDPMENRKTFISKGIQSQDVRRTSNLATRIKKMGEMNILLL